MVTIIYSYIRNCISFIPTSWVVIVLGMLGLVFADGLVGIIDRAWRLIGR